MSEPNKDEASVTIQEPAAPHPPPPVSTEDNNVEVKSGMSTWKIVAISASVVTVVGLALGLGLGLGLKSDDPATTTVIFTTTSSTISTSNISTTTLDSLLTTGEMTTTTLDNLVSTTTTLDPVTTTTAPSKERWTHTVNTNDGKIEGYRYDPDDETYNGQPINNLLPNIEHNTTYFLGIPYASPPVDELRWKAPEPNQPWTHTLKGDKVGPACAQKCDEPCDEAKSSEDCLYLNVFVPNRAIDKEDKVPVSIWIHGGAFRWGQGGSILYDGRVVAGQADHIIITLNYRLSAFGFFYKNFIESGQTNDGNWGFLDQQMAIKWVKENIASFNGDPDRITVYGESAGAISSIQHVINEESQKYFNSAIVQSNPLAIPFKEAWEAAIQGNIFAKEIGCPTFDMTCLRQKSTQDIIKATDRTPIIINSENILHAAMPFGPVVEGNVIKKQPIDSLLDGDFDKTKKIMWGQVEHETEIYVRTVFGEPINNVIYDRIWRILIQDQDKTDKILERYPSQCDKSGGLFDALIKYKWNEQMMKPGDLLSEDISQYAPSNCENMCKETCKPEDGPLCGLLSEMDNCKAITTLLCQNICNTDDIDDRRTAEPPATQWIFTCPVRKALKVMGSSVYMYEFRDFMPVDLTRVGDDGDGWENYDSCDQFACHGAELSYCFASEAQLNCSAVDELADELDFDPEIFTNCYEGGSIVTKEAQKMERYMHRYWANFMATGNPNDENWSKGDYYQNFPDETLASVGEWKTFGEGNNGWQRISSQADLGGITFEENFHADDCDFWDSLDVY